MIHLDLCPTRWELLGLVTSSPSIELGHVKQKQERRTREGHCFLNEARKRNRLFGIEL